MDPLLDQEGCQRFLQQVFDLWVNPEIERRRQAGTLPPSFQLESAQVIMNVGEPTLVRLNIEVRAVMRVVPAVPVKESDKGNPIYWDQISSIEEIQLLDLDPNAGHVTMLKAPKGWAISFDFRYNAQRVQELLQTAEEFLDSAEHAGTQNHPRVFMENLFAAAELTAKARLMMEPDEQLLKAKSHKLIGQKINLEGHLGNVDRDFVRLLNQLTRERGTARYVEGKVDLETNQMASMAGVVRSCLGTVKSSAPVRYSSKNE